jgi:hypothetical protein
MHIHPSMEKVSALRQLSLQRTRRHKMVEDGSATDFGGTLIRDAEAKIEAGLSGVEIKIPASAAAKIVAETTLVSVDVEDGFTKREGALRTEAGITGEKSRS